MESENNKRIEKLENQIEDLKLELFQLLCPYPSGFPIYIQDGWKRVGTLKGFQKIQGKAVVVLQLHTKDKTPYDYYCYDPYRIKPLK